MERGGGRLMLRVRGATGTSTNMRLEDGMALFKNHSSDGLLYIFGFLFCDAQDLVDFVVGGWM